MAIVKYSRILARSVGWVMRVTDFQEKINCMLENSRKSYGYYWLKTVKLGKKGRLLEKALNTCFESQGSNLKSC